MVKIRRILVPTELDSVLGEYSSSASRVFVHFFGTATVETGESWCPDCILADPIIRRWINKIPDSILIECPCNRDEYKGNPEFIYRKHPEFQLKSIPTLYEYSKGKVIKRIEDCDSDDLFKDLLNAQ